MYPDTAENLSYETEDAVYFFSSKLDPLNNWSAHAIRVWGKTFPTLEHAYHYHKYSEVLPRIAERILVAPSPWAAMQIASAYKHQRREDWNTIKVEVMTELVRAKVSQNEDVRNCLLETGTKQLIENSPWDTFWGAGKNGKGENRVGKVLMKVRDEIVECGQ